MTNAFLFSGMPRRREFPYLKHDSLTENQREKVLTKLSDEFETIKSKFSSLAYQTLQSLKISGKNPCDVHALIKEYVPKKHKILDYLEMSEKIDKLFIRNYWSFFDYELLALVIKNCCPDLNVKLSEYVATFNAYCCRRVSEVPTSGTNFTLVSGRHFIIRVKLGKEFSITMKEIKELENSLRKITEIDLSISKFELGSIVVVFVSLSEEDNMLPLNEEGKHELFERGVLKLYSDNNVYFDYNEYIIIQETDPLVISKPCHEIISEPMDKQVDESMDEAGKQTLLGGIRSQNTKA